MLALWGAGLTAAAAVCCGMAWGEAGATAALGFGLLATAIQLAALRLMRGQQAARFDAFLLRWGAGMGLRLVGVVVFMVVVSLWRDVVPPLPAAIGFLGVLLPLLVLELRRVER